MPHYTAWVNCLRCGLNAILFWVSLLLSILVFSTDSVLDPKTGHVKWYEKNYEQRQVLTTVRVCALRPALAACCSSAVHMARPRRRSQRPARALS